MTVKGKSVSEGVAVGTVKVLKKVSRDIKRRAIGDIDSELARFRQALEMSTSQLKELTKKALSKVGEKEAAIFEIHSIMLEDKDYIDSVENIITSEKVSAEYAVFVTAEKFEKMFSSMDDEYMRARSADVRDISERLINNLIGEKDCSLEAEEPVILLADDLSPAQTLRLDKSKILAFVTSNGSAQGHTAILSRTMGIPAVVDTKSDFDSSLNGQTAAVDGDNGVLYLEPDDGTLKEMLLRQSEYKNEKKLLEGLKGKDNVTPDGRRIDIFANIGGLNDIDSVIASDAGGIGLFRSEFIYLQRTDFPSEDEQFEIYKTAAEKMDGKKVVIRTLDVGADKTAVYLGLEKEENPAMGLRAIRLCLERPEILTTQLRAIYRASAFGNISVMYPMITSISEVREIKKLSASVREALKNENIPFGSVEEGVMIETPAAALCSDLLAPEVDFFSVGTNDLSQYTLAVDRQNSKLARFFDPKHTAILRLIQLAADNAHKYGKWIGVCGELGSDKSMLDFFLDIGIDELSVSPSRVLPLRRKIRTGI